MEEVMVMHIIMSYHELAQGNQMGLVFVGALKNYIQ